MNSKPDGRLIVVGIPAFIGVIILTMTMASTRKRDSIHSWNTKVRITWC